MRVWCLTASTTNHKLKQNRKLESRKLILSLASITKKSFVVFRYICLVTVLCEKQRIHICCRGDVWKSMQQHKPPMVHSNSTPPGVRQEAPTRLKWHKNTWTRLGLKLFLSTLAEHQDPQSQSVFFTYILIQHLRTPRLAGSHNKSHCPFKDCAQLQILVILVQQDELN